MKPIIFAENENNFTTNGLGRLDCISCIVIEERNGAYELEMELYATTAHASDIAMNSIIGAIPCDGGTIQAFRVYAITKPINGRFTVYARHISYDLTKIPCMPFSIAASPTAATNTLAALKSNAVEDCPFTFWTDVTTAAAYKQALPASIRQRLGGVSGSVLDQFGGEYEWDNYSVKLHKQRGRIDTGITLRYGKNITDVTQEENIANTVTGVVPFWSDLDGVNVVTLPEKAVYSVNADRYPFHLTAALDLSGNWEEQPSVNSLRLAAQAYVNKSGLGIPKVSIEVSFVELWQTEEYKEVAPLQRVKLCDEVTVEFEKLGISETAKVVKTEYDVLDERYKSIQLGNLRSTLVSTLNDQNASTIQTIDLRATQTSDAINKATAWLTSANGYIVAVKNQDGSWKELLAMNTNDPATATKVMRLNENGLGGSSSGIDGPYLSAILSDGTIVATMIATGILQDHNGNFVLNLDTGTLTIGGGAGLGDGTETVSSTLTKITATASGLTSEVRRAQDAEGVLEDDIEDAYTLIEQNADAIALKVSKGNLSSELSLETGAITLNTTGRLIMTSGNFKLDATGTMSCVNADIQGTITLGKANNSAGTLSLYESDGSTIRLQLNNTGMITNGRSNINQNVTFKAVYGFKGSFNTGLVDEWYSNAITYYKNSESTPFASMGVFDSTYSGMGYPALKIWDKSSIYMHSNDEVWISGFYQPSQGYGVADLRLASNQTFLSGNEVHISAYNNGVFLSGQNGGISLFGNVTFSAGTISFPNKTIYSAGYTGYTGSKSGNYRFINGIAVIDD